VSTHYTEVLMYSQINASQDHVLLFTAAQAEGKVFSRYFSVLSLTRWCSWSRTWIAFLQWGI